MNAGSDEKFLRQRSEYFTDTKQHVQMVTMAIDRFQHVLEKRALDTMRTKNRRNLNNRLAYSNHLVADITIREIGLEDDVKNSTVLTEAKNRLV